jgi:hypothetical protein
MHAPTDVHMNLVKHILRYIKITLHHGIHLSKSSLGDLVIYANASWAGCPDTQQSTYRFCAYIGGNHVSWSSKPQHTVSRLSAETEYQGVANGVAKSCWLQQLLTELGHPPKRATIVFCDNVSAFYMSHNPFHHQRTKHIEIDLHFVRDKISLGEVKVLHVPSSRQYADIFTKGLPSTLFEEFRSSLNLYPCPG